MSSNDCYQYESPLQALDLGTWSLESCSFDEDWNVHWPVPDPSYDSATPSNFQSPGKSYTLNHIPAMILRCLLTYSHLALPTFNRHSIQGVKLLHSKSVHHHIPLMILRCLQTYNHLALPTFSHHSIQRVKHVNSKIVRHHLSHLYLVNTN